MIQTDFDNASPAEAPCASLAVIMASPRPGPQLQRRDDATRDRGFEIWGFNSSGWVWALVSTYSIGYLRCDRRVFPWTLASLTDREI